MLILDNVQAGKASAAFHTEAKQFIRYGKPGQTHRCTQCSGGYFMLWAQVPGRLEMMCTECNHTIVLKFKEGGNNDNDTEDIVKAHATVG